MNGPLDREQQGDMHFRVQAYDQGWPMQIAEVDVHVTILDQDDNAPMLEWTDGERDGQRHNGEDVDGNRTSILLLHLEMAENARIGTVLTRLWCRDPDEVGHKKLFKFF